MGIRLIGGLSFTELDAKDSRKVAIVNETLARRYLPGGDVIGKRAALIFESMRFYPDRAPELDIPLGMREIVGVVADVKHSNLESAPVPEMFIPHSQRPVGRLPPSYLGRARAGAHVRRLAPIEPPGSRGGRHRPDRFLPAFLRRW